MNSITKPESMVAFTAVANPPQLKPPLRPGSLWDWLKREYSPSLGVWLLVSSACLIVQGVLWLPVLLSFRVFAFLDSGSGLIADRLVAAGRLPGIDFGYYHGLLPLVMGRAWFSMFGDTPQAYLALRAVIALVSLIVFFYLFRAVRASGVVYVMSCAAIPFVFFYRPSLNHDMAGLGISLALLWLVNRRYGLAAAAALFSAFCHPSLGYLMLALIPVSAAAREWGDLRRLLRVATALSAWSVGVLGAYFVLCYLFFHSAGPFLKTLLPLVGSSVRTQHHWSFWNGGLTFIHPPGSNWKYFVGSAAASYVLFNLILVGTAAALLLSWLRHRWKASPAVVLVGCCFAIHAIYVLFVFGVPDTWNYDAYLLVLGLAAIPFARARHWLALGMTGALLLGSYGSLATARQAHHEARVDGLWISPALASDLQAIREREPGTKPYVWSMSGALSLIDPRFESPERWFINPGSNPAPEMARLKGELLAHPVFLLYEGRNNPDYLFANPDFSDLRSSFREAGHAGEFTVCVRRPEVTGN
jgi:hypothetical protein